MFLLLYLVKNKMKYLAESVQLEPLILGISLFSTLIAIIFGYLFYQIDSEFVWLFYGLAVAFVNLDFKCRNQFVNTHVMRYRPSGHKFRR